MRRGKGVAVASATPSSSMDTGEVIVQESDSDDVPKAAVIRIPPHSYVHLLDTNLNVTRLEVGPKSMTCLDHEKVAYGPAKMIVVPPRHYCVISNPVVTFVENEKKQVKKDQYGQAKLHHGDSEIRFEQEPFPLYPGESIVGGIQLLKVIATDQALRLRALRNFTDKYEKEKDGSPIRRQAGEEWLFEGPRTYIPQVEVEIVEIINATVLAVDQALHLRARREFKDRSGRLRKAGEEWSVQTEGAYLPGVDETVVKVINGIVLEKNKKAVHLRASVGFTDCFGKDRKAGEEWLVTYEDHEVHIPHVFEEVVGQVNAITLTSRQFCIILDPVDNNGKPQLGQRKFMKGPANFFLKPGEKLSPEGVSPVYILEADEALIARATEGFEDTTGRKKRIRHGGDRWYIYGPGEYFPPLQVQLPLERRRAILRIDPLGIYMFYSPLSLVLFFIFVFILTIFAPSLLRLFQRSNL